MQQFTELSDLLPLDTSNQPGYDGAVDDLLPMRFEDTSAVARFVANHQLRSAIFAQEFPILSQHCGMMA